MPRRRGGVYRIPEDDKRAVLELANDGLEYSTIATRLGISKGSVQGILYGLGYRRRCDLEARTPEHTRLKKRPVPPLQTPVAHSEDGWMKPLTRAQIMGSR